MQSTIESRPAQIGAAVAPPVSRVFRSREEVQACIDRAPHTMPAWGGEEGPRWRITVSPGSIQVGTKDYARIAATEERARQRALRETGAMEVVEEQAPPKRGRVTAWSRESRARMVRRLCTLDYVPLFAGQHAPALVTLTLPHDWESVAGSAAEFKKIVNRWRASWTAQWGGSPVAVWKMEFQYRVACAAAGCHDPRAPHLHLLMRLPDVPVEEFRTWLARTWTKAVRPSRAVEGGQRDVLAHRPADSSDTRPCDCSEWCRHLSAGTAVDFEETLRYGDAKRVAVYFTKHGTFASKEYQNELPEAWDVERAGGARFWGYWTLQPAEGVLETDPELAAFAARVLRHVHDAQRYGEQIPGAETIGDPHKRRLLGRKRSVWRSSRLPADLAALPLEVLTELVAGETDGFEESPEKLISAIMSAHHRTTPRRAPEPARVRPPAPSSTGR